ncbi:MAG TPA: fibronectin/fibrinogen-binding protein [Clostridiales bacterium]|nr:fibronectin/fibrinogen-binding protein [Clostridiales bacterium]
MPLDAITMTALVRELSPKITGARIDKIQQPERDVLLFTLRNMGENLRLLISARSGTARLHLTSGEFENPQSPPMFCMLLRKHLLGARIASVTQPKMERLVILELDAFDEMGSPVKKRLIAEFIGRSSNVILTGPQGHIIDCLRRIDSDMNGSKRQVLPGLLYRLPPAQDRPLFFDVPSNEKAEMWRAADGEKQADKWLLESFSGLSPLICRELCYRCFGDTGPRISGLTAEQKASFPAIMDVLADSVSKNEFQPTMLLDGKEPRDFSFMNIKQYGNSLNTQAYPSFSQLLEAFYSDREKAELMRRRSSGLTRTVKTARDRIRRKLALQKQELLKTGERDTYRKFGDLITANIYRLKKGDSLLTATDFYVEDCPEVSIPLDPLKTPQQNAAAYYKSYNKAKAAEAHLTELITRGESELDYLSSVLDAIERAEGESDLIEIRRELVDTGYIKPRKSAKDRKSRDAGPMRFMSHAGVEILVGRNNLQNDLLTTKLAHKADIWLHAQKIHGSHVIIRCGGREVDPQTLEEAASLAAYFSQGRDGAKVPVDYTQVKYVKKTKGALPGMVIYTDCKTIMAQPDEELARRLRVK